MLVLVILAASALSVWLGVVLLRKSAEKKAARALPLIEEEGILTTQRGIRMTGSWSRSTLHFVADVRVTSRAIYLSPKGDPLVIIPLTPEPLARQFEVFNAEARLIGEPKVEGTWVVLHVKVGLGRETIKLEPLDLERFLGALKLASGQSLAPAS